MESVFVERVKSRSQPAITGASSLITRLKMFYTSKQNSLNMMLKSAALISALELAKRLLRKN